MNIIDIVLISFNAMICVALFVSCIAAWRKMGKTKKKIINTSELSPRNAWRLEHGGID